MAKHPDGQGYRTNNQDINRKDQNRSKHEMIQHNIPPFSIVLGNKCEQQQVLLRIEKIVADFADSSHFIGDNRFSYGLILV